ncbi:MAG: GNAT family N-acetyltransferase [Lentisphaeria bacterium]|nr:GNAT family N-acetyltransferase [Lentisphaeria bacterium]NQZ69015.1 GNAT family N-acetyltransferase [Lentisphaeria bacterium]
MPDMLVKLYELPDPALLVQNLSDAGITIRRVMPYEKQKCLDWVGENFSDGWMSECDVSFSNNPCSSFIATENSTIIGFASYDSTNKNFFGPTGVSESARGRGVGKALLLVALQAMKDNGYAYAIIGGVGPKEFYAKAVGAIEIEGSVPGIYRDPLS